MTWQTPTLFSRYDENVNVTDAKAIPMEMAIYKMVREGNDHLFVSGEDFKILSDGSLSYRGSKFML